MHLVKILLFKRDFATADLVTFTEDILNGKLHSLCIVSNFCDCKEVQYKNLVTRW